RISSCVSSHQAAAIKTECMAAIDYVRFNLKMLLQMGGVHVCAERTELAWLYCYGARGAQVLRALTL
ncbi:hypothetical protein, partial [Undibacterium sp. Ji49W]|uniref:hypothetical protein n=1 Tax=Undibacterium sp. Ji49W TaxID=3413040 RepID=UPI003BF26BD0